MVTHVWWHPGGITWGTKTSWRQLLFFGGMKTQHFLEESHFSVHMQTPRACFCRRRLGMSGRKALPLKAQQSLNSELGYTSVNELCLNLQRDSHMYSSCPEKVKRESFVFWDKTIFSSFKKVYIPKERMVWGLEGSIFWRCRRAFFMHSHMLLSACIFLNKRAIQTKTLMAFPVQKENSFELVLFKSERWGFAVILLPLWGRAWEAPGGQPSPVARLCPSIWQQHLSSVCG